MIVARSLAQLREARQSLGGLPVALVPTMGALHRGHLALLARAREAAGTVAASIFVNPTQFNAGEDFARYPRDEAADLAMLRQAGCDLAWVPDAATMYPPGDATAVEPGGPAEAWEGEHRPGHFRGMATVVAKLFGQVRPHAAVFGEKDWQQLQVVRRMAADLHLGVDVVGLPTVREADGLALSSRNRLLSPGERRTAPALHRTLLDVAAALGDGREPGDACASGSRALADAGFGIDYLALIDGETLRPLSRVQDGARLIAAARLGSVRLLDNIGV